MERCSDTLTATAWTTDELKIIRDALKFSKEKMTDFTALNSNTLSDLIPSDFSEEIRNKIKWRVDKLDSMINKITEIIKSAENRKRTYNFEDYHYFQNFGV